LVAGGGGEASAVMAEKISKSIIEPAAKNTDMDLEKLFVFLFVLNIKHFAS
jgi:hypothetical protein